MRSACTSNARCPHAPQFLKNFWEGFKEVLGSKHVIKCLEKCDFTPIWEWNNAQREAKKKMTKEVRARGAAPRRGGAAHQ